MEQQFSVVNFNRDLDIRLDTFDYTIEYNNDKNIDSIIFKDNSKISIDKKLIVNYNQNKYVYYPKDIIDKNGRCFELISPHINLSYYFILPFCGNNFTIFYNNFFENTYLHYDSKKIDNKTIYIIYRKINNDDFGLLHKKLLSLPSFKEYIECAYNENLYEFTIPDKYNTDISKIVNGEYSKISTEGKTIIINFHKLTKDDILYKILYKDKLLKNKYNEILGFDIGDVELFSKLKINNEKYKHN